MEKETYKKAKEILERFDPEKYKKMEVRKRFVVPSHIDECLHFINF